MSRVAEVLRSSEEVKPSGPFFENAAASTGGSSKTGQFKSYIRKSSPRQQFESFAPWDSSTSKHNGSDAVLTTPIKAAEAAVPISSEPQVADFKSLVTEYGRSIIKSAMDHEPEEAATLKNDIMTAKEKIIVRHSTVENELKIAEAENLTLKSSVFAMRLEVTTAAITKRLDRSTIEGLEKQLKDQTEKTMRCVDLLEKEKVKRKALEVESADLKRDRKRKRDSVAAIWEDAESVKFE